MVSWGDGTIPGTVGDAYLGTVISVVQPWGPQSVKALTGWLSVTVSWEPSVEGMWVEEAGVENWSEKRAVTPPLPRKKRLLLSLQVSG